MARRKPDTPSETRILVVEDSRTQARWICDKLEAANRDVSTRHAERLAQAFEQLTENEFDAIVLDLTLADSDGLATLRSVRETVPEVPVVVLTGADDDRTAGDALALGAQDYLVKDRIDGEQLLRVVRYAIERRRAALKLRDKSDALKTSENRYRWMFEYSPIPMLEINHTRTLEKLAGLAGRTGGVAGPTALFDHDFVAELLAASEVTAANAAALELIGADSVDVFENLNDLIHDSSYESLGKSYFALATGAKPEEYDIKVVRTDGDSRVVKMRFAATMGESDLDPKAIVSVVDQTDRISAESALRESETRLSELVEHMSSGVAVYTACENGADFVFREFNRAGESIDRLRREEVLGRRLTSVYPEAEQFGLLEVFRRVWRTGRPEHVPAALYRDERICGWRENYIYKLPSGEVVAIYDDVTRRKEAEIALGRRLVTEQVLVSVSSRFIAPASFQGAVEGALGDIANYWRGDRAVIYVFEKDGNVLRKFAEWLPNSKRAQGRAADLVSYSPLSRIKELLNDDKIDVVDVSNMPEGKDRDWLTSEGVRTHVTLPLRTGEETIGFARFDNVSGPAGWNNEDYVAISALHGVLCNAFGSQRALRKLHEQTRLFENLLEAIPHFVFWKNRDLVYQGCSRNFAVAAGVDRPKDIVGKTDHDLAWKREEADFFRKCDLEVMESGTALLNIEEPQRRADGSDTTLLTSKVPLKNEDGDIVGILGVFTDITDRKQADEQLRIQSAALDSTTYAIVITDRYGAIRWVNPAFELLTGYSADEVVGSNPRILQSGKHDRSFYERMWTTIESGDVWQGEITNRRKDGSEYVEHMTITPVGDEKGKEIAHFVAVKYDVSERKVLETQLVQAQKLESIGQLAAGIAHEINTPIQFIGDNTRFLRDAFADLGGLVDKYGVVAREVEGKGVADGAVTDARDTEEQVDLEYLQDEIPKAIDQSLEGVEAVARIVRAMKEFSHPGQEQKSPANINKAIENTATISKNEWKYVSNVSLDLDPSLPDVMCLPGELNQVFLNLIVNAAHAIEAAAGGSEGEKGTITIGTRRAGDNVEIWISDTGCGIPEHARSRIFDPFYTTKDVGKGSGQGLAIARSVIVDKHFGTIQFETEIGVGTTFVITLPVAPPEPANDNKSNKRETAKI